jgi:hypothetical protein
MAALTDNDMDAFADYMQGVLDKNKKAISEGDGAGSGWDPTSRIAQLHAGGQAVIDAGGVETQMEQALRSQTASKQALRKTRYELASASVSAVEGALGKKHPLVNEMRQKRSTFSKPPSKPKPAAPK